MYGRGNYASPPQFGQGLQRPMPPYLQQAAGHPSASHFQPGISMPPQPVIQQGGAPHGVPPRAPAYPPARPGPPSMPHQGPPASTSNTGQPFLHPPQGGAPAQLSYLTGQQNFVSGSQNPQPPPPPPSSMGPSRAPPPPPFMQLPPPPPPPSGAGFLPPVKFESAKQQSTDSDVSAAAPSPPLPPSSPPRAPPPPSSCSSSSPRKLATPTNTAARSPTQLGHDPTPEQVAMSESSSNVLLALPPPPPKPADENIARNIEVLCQFIAKNGPEFEEMARKNESGNPEFNFLVGGDPGSEASCAHEYFLWMKKKCGLENLMQKSQGQKDLSQSHVEVEPSTVPNSLPNVGTAHSPTDSDVDMEDDITQSDKEHGVYNSTEDVEPEAVSAGNLCERHKQDSENGNQLQYSGDNDPAPKLSPSVMSQAGAETKSEISAGQPTNSHSPFRLIQNYASEDSSDDNGEPSHDLVKAKVGSPLGKSGALSSHDDSKHGNMNLKSNTTSETGLVQSATACSETLPTKNQDDMQLFQGGLEELPTKALPGKYENDDREDGTEGSNPNAVSYGRYADGNSGVDSVYKDVEKEDKRNTAAAVRVDEFGRMVKEGASESESDDAHHLRRRGRRDRSRSRSPSDGRRRRSPRRSPRRRKERRSRSRSWSPKKRRSRSRSPHRSGGDFRGENLRRGKVQTRECFDFLKGRCYRGASCRYLHHETDKNENSRRYSSNPDFHGGSVTLKSPREHNGVKVEKLHLHLDKNDNRDLALSSDNTSKAKSIDDAVLARFSHHDAEKIVTDDVKVCAGPREADQVLGASDETISNPPILEKHPSSGMPPNEQMVHHLRTEASAGEHDRSDKEPQKMDDSWKTDSSTIQVSATSGVSDNEPYASKMFNESTAPNASGQDFPHLVSHLPPPPPLPQQATNFLRGPNMQADYNLLAPSVSVPPQSVPVASGPLYQAPLPNQQSHYSVPSNPAWSTLPQPRPPPPHMAGPSMTGTPLQFQQGSFPVRNDFQGQMPLRVHPGELASHSQVGGFPHQTFHMPSSSIPTQPFAGQNLVRDERYPQFPIQSHVPSSSFAPGVASQPVPFQGDSTVNNTQSFPVDNQFAQQRLPPYAPQLTASESVTSHVGGSASMPGYSSNPLDRDTPSLFDVGGPRISTHYNPYASTFDQPLSTRFSSVAFTQEKRDAAAAIKYDSSFGLGHAQINGQTAGDQGSRQIVSSNSSKAEGQTLPKSGGDQYDPLFDSIDPYSGSLEKHAKKQDHAADNSEIMLKLSRHNVLDVEENNKQKVVGAVVATASLENEEFGETADAEVGAVENESPSNNNEDMDDAEGDVEIDQVKPEGKSKKTKDSRSMKLFKVAVANFVKEVLKPQWRQGNMSKEVFKTIVKKTVDKVSGAMKNHRVPKSQAKIDHYIDSSRRKLTQLVEGYVSKYKS